LPSGKAEAAPSKGKEKGTKDSSLLEIINGAAAPDNSATPLQSTDVGAEHVHGPIHEGEGAHEYNPQRLPDNELHQDTGERQLLIEKLGVSEASASELVSLAAQNGRREGYITDLVEYATTARGIKNPAGLVAALIQRNETRSPGDHHNEAQVIGIDPRNYSGNGKYAFLFADDHRRRRGPDPNHAAHPPDDQLPDLDLPEAASG
jgi:hypothetical protein